MAYQLTKLSKCHFILCYLAYMDECWKILNESTAEDNLFIQEFAQFQNRLIIEAVGYLTQ